MGKMGSYGKKVSRRKLAEGIPDEECSLSLEYEAELDLLVLMQFGVEVLRPVLLDDQGRIVWFGDDEGQDFHRSGLFLWVKNIQIITNKGLYINKNR